jgi:DNA-binding response OmpR family regulator
MELKKPDAPADGEKFRILLVEDDFDIARMLLQVLKKANFECYYGTDGMLGLQAFEAKDPHLVLLDVMLPRMSGRDVCVKIRETSAVPIIMLTAMSTPDDQMLGLKLGADGYITKPFNPTLVVGHVISQLRRAYQYDFQEPHAPEAPPAPEPISDAEALSIANDPLFADPESEEEVVPENWIQCEACNYMGPREQFEYEDIMGRETIRCPKCKNRDFVIFSLG